MELRVIMVISDGITGNYGNFSCTLQGEIVLLGSLQEGREVKSFKNLLNPHINFASMSIIISGW